MFVERKMTPDDNVSISFYNEVDGQDPFIVLYLGKDSIMLCDVTPTQLRAISRAFSEAYILLEAARS
jgi:hypothetical protein